MTNLNKPLSEMRQTYPGIPDAMERATRRHNESIFVIGYHPDSDVGGGNLVYDANRPKSDHNGGTVIDPDQTFPSDWNDSAQVAAWFTADGAGNGVWVRPNKRESDLFEWGAKTDGSISTPGTIVSKSISAALSWAAGNHKKLTVSTDGANNPTYYEIDETIVIPERGLSLVGANMRQVAFRNSTNASSLVAVGDTVANAHAQYSELKGFMLQGNSSTAEGLALKGPDNDGLSDASKVCSIDRIRILDVGSGSAMRVSSWNNNIGLVEILDSQYGFEIGDEANAISISNLRITNCDRHGLWTNITNTARTSAINIDTLTIQQCGSVSYGASLYDAGRGFNINTLYLEDNEGTDVVVNAVRGFKVGQWTFAKTDDPTHVIFNLGNDAVSEIGGGSVFGTVQNHVSISGSSTKTIIHPVSQQTGSVTESIDDTSTNKLTISFHQSSDGVTLNRGVINSAGVSSGALIVKVEGSEKFRIKGDGQLSFTSNNGSLRPRNAGFEFWDENSNIETFRIDNTTASGNTRFMIYDNDNGTLERVTVGAPDSGGVGFKVLRIPN